MILSFPKLATRQFGVQDSFYKYHNEEELALAHANMLDFDHPDAIDMPMFASVCSQAWLYYRVLIVRLHSV